MVEQPRWWWLPARRRAWHEAREAEEARQEQERLLRWSGGYPRHMTTAAQEKPNEQRGQSSANSPPAPDSRHDTDLVLGTALYTASTSCTTTTDSSSYSSPVDSGGASCSSD